MKTIILAGGKESCLNAYTEIITKLMIKISGKSILSHIMQTFAKFEHKDFYDKLINFCKKHSGNNSSVIEVN